MPIVNVDEVLAAVPPEVEHAARGAIDPHPIRATLA
jgi:hypothetical protein